MRIVSEYERLWDLKVQHDVTEAFNTRISISRLANRSGLPVYFIRAVLKFAEVNSVRSDDGDTFDKQEVSNTFRSMAIWDYESIFKTYNEFISWEQSHTRKP
ncbi:MAG: hypothetical protein BA863_07740 [Desulfovibrio sp. S3730MH75]|nr:MAG: hypothetical protein BA863_07740 [Desulfovibrio sp. S3730MH75]